MSAPAPLDTTFSLRLHDALADAETGGDLFVSPLSIQVALAMLGAGARGETRRVVAGLIAAPESVEEQNRRYAAWARQLRADIAAHVQLTQANGLWGQPGGPVKASYRQVLAETYDADYREVDFAAAPDEAVQTINAWVAGKTHGKITTLLRRDLVGPDTRLMVTNAIYFKGRWENPFDPRDTLDEDWHGPDGVRKVPIMQQRHSFLYAETDEYQALDVPYQGGALSMLVVLPRETNGLAALERAGAATNCYRRATVALAPEGMVIASLPRFKLASTFSLKPILSELGGGPLFDAGADFGAISDEPLQLADVVHQARIEVNEEGTEAAAATAATALKSAISKIKCFLADHPFLFFIRHRPSDAVLFSGRVLEPE